jgi:hypothetical protein
MATQIEILQQQKKLLAEIANNLEIQNRSLKNQNEIYSQIVENIKKMNVDSAIQGAQQLTKVLQETAKESASASGEQNSFYQELKKHLRETGEETELLTKLFGNMIPVANKTAQSLSFWQGLKEGIEGVVAIGRSMTSVLYGASKVLWNVALAVISFPFSMLQQLIDYASNSGDNELARQLEEIRKEFGYLNKTAGGAVITLARSLKGELANTGLSTYRVFGNLVERLQYFFEYAKNLGETLDAAMRRINIREDAEALGAFNKALGFSAEEQKAVAQTAIATGDSINEVNRQIANYAIQLSDAFGLTMKEVSRDIGKMMADVHHFGHLTAKEMAQAAVYTRRLGIEFKQLSSVMDKFTNFEDAAQGVAQLSQAFGLNIDAFKLMKEQDPAQKLEMIRKAFFAAGRSVESMTYQERRLLAQQTGLDDAAVKLAFSLKNQSLGYDEIVKKGDQAKKRQLSQVEALEKLANAIERLIKSGNIGNEGFIERFLRGFRVGILYSREFREIMINLRQTLIATYYAGIRVGLAFVKSFPGIRDWFKGISGIFQPARFRQMLNKIVNAFQEFFKDLQDNPRAGFRKFMENLKNGFTSWFFANSPNGQRMISGFKKFFVALSGAIAEGLKIAIKGIAKSLNFIAQLIKDPSSVFETAKTTASGTGSWIFYTLKPIFEAIKESWPILRDSFLNLFEVAFEKIKSNIGPVLQRFWPTLALLIFGPAFTRAIITSLTGSLLNIIGKGIANLFSKFLGMFRNLGSVEIPSSLSKQTENLNGLIKSQEQLGSAMQGSKVNWGNAILKAGLIAGFIFIITHAIMPKIIDLAKTIQEGNITTENILKVVGSVVAISGAMAMISFSVSAMLKTSQMISGAAIGKAAVGLAVIALVTAGMVYGAQQIIKAFSDFETSKIDNAVKALGSIGKIYLIASGVTVLATIIGAAVTGSFGIGAAAIAAGLIAIAATTTVMVTHGMAIMNAIDKFKPSGSISDFEAKTKAFTNVINTIGSFAGTVAQIIAATSPSIIELITNSGESRQQETLKQVEKIIRTLGEQMINIVNVVRDSIQSLFGSERELKSAQILGEVLGAVVNLGNVLRPPSEILNDPGFWAELNLDGVTDRIIAFSRYISVISNSLQRFIEEIKTLIVGDLSNGLTENQKNAVAVIPSLLSGIGDLAQALRPSSSFIAEASKGDFQQIMRHTSYFIEDVLHSIKNSGLFEKISEVINVIAVGFGSLNSEQLKTLNATAPVFRSIFSTISTIASVMGRGPMGGDIPRGQQTVINPSDAGTIYQMIQLVNTVFERISNGLPILITNIRTAFSGMTKSDADFFSRGVEGISKIFEVLPKIPEALSSLKGLRAEEIRNSAISNTDIISLLENFNKLLSGGSGQQGLVRIIDRLTKGFVIITNSISNPIVFSQKIQAIKNIFDILGSIPSMLEGMQRVSGNNNVVPTNVMQQPLMNLSRIVDSLASPTIDGTIPNPLLNNRINNILTERQFTGITSATKTKITNTLGIITDLTGEFSRIQNNEISIRQGTNNLIANITALENFMTVGGNKLLTISQELPVFINNIRDVNFASVARQIKRIIDEINAMNEQINNIGTIDINAPIRNVANILSVKQEEYRIKHGDLAINIEVKFSVDARDLETAIIDRPLSRVQIRPVEGLPPLRFRR